MQKKKVYVCDPRKNPTCKKTGCWLYSDGDCYLTTDPEKALSFNGVPITPAMLKKGIRLLKEEEIAKNSQN